MSALSTDDAGSPALVPHWLDGDARDLLGVAVRAALQDRSLHPVTAVHLHDVLTELHVAAAREAVWPAATARVRLATGWDDDVLPVRLSPAELAGVLGIAELPERLRGHLDGGGRR